MQDRALARINTIDALTFPSLGEKNNGRSRSGFLEEMKNKMREKRGLGREEAEREE